MRLFLTRHGQSEKNVGLSESRDSKLRPKGIDQAAKAALALRPEGIECLFSSPQHRALQTGYIIAEELDIPHRLYLNLSEHAFSWEEKGLLKRDIAKLFPRTELPDFIDDAGWARHWTSEEDCELDRRMAEMANELIQIASSDYEAIACVIHEGSGSKLLRHLLGVRQDAPTFFRHENCGITRKFVLLISVATSIIA